MRHYLFIIVLFFRLGSPGLTYAQINLVPNPSFEDTSNCPFFGAYMSSSPWFNPNTATPDYFTTNSTCGVNITTNSSGYQLPFDGDNYIGLYLFQTPGSRDYAEVELTSTLLQNHIYRISYYVSLSNAYKRGSDRFEACLSDTIIYNNISGNYYLTCNSINLNPTLAIVTDTLNWVKMSADYVATGNERYLTIGNFKHDSLTSSQLFNPSGIIDGAYYYIDSVTVREIGVVGINNIKAEMNNFFPNPMSDFLNYSVLNKGFLNIYNSIGQLCFSSSIIDLNGQINVRSLTAGLYQLQFRNDTLFINFKLIKL